MPPVKVSALPNAWAEGTWGSMYVPSSICYLERPRLFRKIRGRTFSRSVKKITVPPNTPNTGKHTLYYCLFQFIEGN